MPMSLTRSTSANQQEVDVPELPAAGGLYWDYLHALPIGTVMEFDLAPAESKLDGVTAAQLHFIAKKVGMNKWQAVPDSVMTSSATLHGVGAEVLPVCAAALPSLLHGVGAGLPPARAAAAAALPSPLHSVDADAPPACGAAAAACAAVAAAPPWPLHGVDAGAPPACAAADAMIELLDSL